MYALDTFTENEILKEINNLKDKNYIFYFPQNEHAKIFSDKIYHLEEGKIIDEGDFSKNFKDK